MRNARFWAYVNGDYVKITLRPGQSLSHASGGPCDEGWSVECLTWEHASDEPYVYVQYSLDSQDCDGRHGYQSDSRCHIDNLRAGNEPFDPESRDGIIVFPAWEDARSQNYDQYAEIMGY